MALHDGVSLLSCGLISHGAETRAQNHANQARNFMRDAMRVGDGVLFYHSSCAEPGIAGIARVASTPYPDPTQFDPKVALLRRRVKARGATLAAGGRSGAEQDPQPQVILPHAYQIFKLVDENRAAGRR